MSDYMDAALAREHVELHIGHPDFVDDDDGLGGAEENPGRDKPVRQVVGDPRSDPGASATPSPTSLGAGGSSLPVAGCKARPQSPVWISQFGEHVYSAKEGTR